MVEKQTNRWHIKEVHESVLQAVNQIINEYPHTLEKREYGWKWKFTNGMWCDLLCHDATGPAHFRLSRGAWFVQQNPALAFLFDKTQKVIATQYLASLDDIEQKQIKPLVALMANAPKNIGYMGEKTCKY